MRPIFYAADYYLFAVLVVIVLIIALWFGILPGIGFLWLVGVLP